MTSRTAKNATMTMIFTTPRIVEAISKPRRTLSTVRNTVVIIEVRIAKILKIKAIVFFVGTLRTIVFVAGQGQSGSLKLNIAAGRTQDNHGSVGSRIVFGLDMALLALRFQVVESA